MPFNGSGTFSRLYSWTVDAANNVAISSSRTDAELNGMASGLSNCVTRDGQSPPSADLPMGGKKLVNLGNATVSTDALNMATGDTRYILASGATNLTLSGTLTAATLSISGTATIVGQTFVNSNIIIGTNSGPGNSLYINGASGTSRGIGFQTAGVYAADITLQTDNATIAYKALTAHTFFISGSQVSSFTSTGLSITGTLASSGNATVGGTLGVTGAATIAALTASGLITGNAGFSGTSLALSSTLGVTGLATLNGGITSSGALSLTGALTTGSAVNSVGYVGVPSNVKTANYTLVGGDIGQDITFNAASLTCTIPAGLPNGFVCVIANINASALTITSASDVLTISGATTTGNRTLGQNGEARIIRRNGVFYIAGTALT